MGAQSRVTSRRAQVDTACEISVLLNKECPFAVVLQGGMVYKKWEYNQPEFRYWCCENSHAKSKGPCV
jgi:hypothetical protein